MFCSAKCRDITYERMPKLSRLTFKNIEEEDLSKIYADILGNFGSREKLLEFIKEEAWETLNCSIFDFDFNDHCHPDYGMNLIKCFMSFRFLPKSPSAKILKDPIVQGDISLAKFLKKAIGIFYNMNTKPASHHALALCFGNLLNHSCIPNVEAVPIDDKVAYYVTRPIKEGEQLFVSYVTWGR